MAKSYKDFKDLMASAKLDFGSPFKRSQPIPLDYSSVYGSLADAQNYASTNPTAYVGQVLTVVTTTPELCTKDGHTLPLADVTITIGEETISYISCIYEGTTAYTPCNRYGQPLTTEEAAKLPQITQSTAKSVSCVYKGVTYTVPWISTSDDGGMIFENTTDNVKIVRTRRYTQIATTYVIDNEYGDLKEVGSVPVGDNTTIKVDENGKISVIINGQVKENNAGLVSGGQVYTAIDTAVEGINDKIGEIPSEVGDITGISTVKAYVDAKTQGIASAGHSHKTSDITDFDEVIAKAKVAEAIKATQDGDGNVISTTYIKKDGNKVLSDNNYTNDEKTKLSGIATGATKVEASSTNGNIKIDGVEKTVYTHPEKHTSSDISDFNTAVAAIKVASAGSADTATNATNASKLENRTTAELKEYFKGSITDNNTGFVTGDAVYDVKVTAEAAKARIDAFIDGTNDATAVIDTLVEIQDFMTADTGAFVALSKKVTDIEDGTITVPKATDAETIGGINAETLLAMADSASSMAVKNLADDIDQRKYANEDYVETSIESAIQELDVTDITGMGAGKTIATLTETDGKIAATFQDIAITKSQITDFKENDYQPAGNYKTKQTAVVDPTASGKSLTFIDTIAQDDNGVITATKKTVNLDDYATTTSIGNGKFTVEGTGYLTGGGDMYANQPDNTTAQIDLTTATKAKIDGAVQVSDLASYITGESTPIVTNLIPDDVLRNFNLNETELQDQLNEIKFMPEVGELYQLVFTDISNGKILYISTAESTYESYYEENMSDPDLIPTYSIYFDEPSIICHIDQMHNGTAVVSSAYAWIGSELDEYLQDTIGADSDSDAGQEYLKNNVRYSIYRVSNEVSLGIERGAQVNKIDTVSSNFEIVNKELKLANIDKTTKIAGTKPATATEDLSLLDFINSQITSANLATEQHAHQVADIVGLKEYLLTDGGYTVGNTIYSGDGWTENTDSITLSLDNIKIKSDSVYCIQFGEDNTYYFRSDPAISFNSTMPLCDNPNYNDGFTSIWAYATGNIDTEYDSTDTPISCTATKLQLLISDYETNNTIINTVIDKTITIVELLPNLNIATKTVATTTDIGLVKSTAATVYDAQGNITNTATINKVNVDTDGTMTVNAISIDKLENKDGYTLVLFGGNAAGN